MTPRHSSHGLPTPKSSAKSPLASARSAKSRSTIASRSGEFITGTDGELTDLISEVLAQEGVDMQSAGYSQELADQLEKDAREQIQRERKPTGHTPRDKLISIKKADEHLKKRTLEEREQLKLWMTEKYHERQEEYKRRRNELIEREPKPFKSSSTVTKLNLKALEEEQKEKRISMVSEFMNQRLIEAEHLMGSIMVDKPEIPWEDSLENVSRRTASRSPKRTSSAVSPPRSRAPRRSRSPTRRRAGGATWSYMPESSSRSPHGMDKRSRETSPVKGILKSSTKEVVPSSTDIYLDHPVLASISEGDRTLGSSTDIINYAKHVLEMEESEDFTPMPSYEELPKPKPRPQPHQAPQRRQSPQGPEKAPAVKGKSFADMVRMQRPDITNKWKEINKQRQQQLQKDREREAVRKAVQAKPAATHDPNLQREKTKEYGSKQIPGSSPRQTVPRRVKTYSERLLEMKATKPYSPPPSRRAPGSARSMSSSTVRPNASRGPAHKPQTYVEQLQSIGSKASSTQRSNQSAPSRKKAPVRMRTFLKAHKPLHKPQTYAEQLQALNPHPHSEAHTRKPSMSTVTMRSSGSRSQARSRPYTDPYSEVDYEELASVLSDWEMDENVRNIIYGRGSIATSSAGFMVDDVDVSMSGGDVHHHPRRHMAPSEGPSDYFDVIMQGEAPYRSGEGDELGIGDYRSSVDIHDIERIADLASVGSGSVLSVIDWDAVEDLIKDV